jgi:hypothetical protein
MAQIDARTMRFCSSRLQSLLRSLQAREIHKFNTLALVCDFATLIGTYADGFIVLVEPADTLNDSSIQFWFFSFHLIKIKSQIKCLIDLQLFGCFVGFKACHLQISSSCYYFGHHISS